MTEDKFIEAQKIKGLLENHEYDLVRLRSFQNGFGIPDDMLKRHKEEIRQYHESEIARLQAEFDAL